MRAEASAQLIALIYDHHYDHHVRVAHCLGDDDLAVHRGADSGCKHWGREGRAASSRDGALARPSVRPAPKGVLHFQDPAGTSLAPDPCSSSEERDRKGHSTH